MIRRRSQPPESGDSKKFCHNGILADALHRFVIKLVENHDVLIANRNEWLRILNRLKEMLAETPSPIAQELRGIKDNQEAFTTFCWTIGGTVAESIVSPFKIDDNRFSVLVNTDPVKVTHLLEALQYETQFPDSLWITIGPDGPLVAPVLETRLSQLDSRTHTLIGIIFEENGTNSYLYKQFEIWRDAHGVVVPGSAVLRIISKCAVFLYYQRIINTSDNFEFNLRTIGPPIQHTKYDEYMITKAMDNNLPQLDKRNKPRIVKKQNGRHGIRNGSSLTKLQQVAVKLLDLKPDLSVQFEITRSQFHKLVRIIREKFESRIDINEYLGLSGSVYDIKIINGQLYSRKSTHFPIRCPRCLKDATDTAVDGFQYCVFHYPENTIKFTVFLAVPRFGVGPSKVCFDVCKIDEPPKTSRIHTNNNNSGGKYPELIPDPNHIYTTKTLKEANFIHCLLVLGCWMQDASKDYTNKQCLWINFDMAGIYTPDPTLAKDILGKFGITWNSSPIRDTQIDWLLSDALNYTFVFSGQYRFPAVYIMEFGHLQNSDVVYIGKNASPQTVVNCRVKPVKFEPLLDSRVLVSSPNIAINEYLEAVVQGLFVLASALGLENNGRQFTVANCYIESLVRRPNRSFEEYFNVFSKKYFGISVSIK